MVADSVSSVIYLLHQRQVLLHLQSHHEERSRDIIFLQRTQHGRCPAAVWSVIEGDNELFILTFTKSLDGICWRKGVIILLRDKAVILIYCHWYISRVRLRCYFQHLSRSNEINIIGAVKLHQLLNRHPCHILPRHILTIEAPYTFVFSAQTPQTIACEMIFSTKAHDIKGGRCISKEHLMNLSIISVLIREVNVVGVIIELYLCICVQCGSHCLVEWHRRSRLPIRPVISVSCHTEYYLVVRDVLSRPVGSFLHPTLRTDSSWLTPHIMFIVRHEEEIVIILCQFLHVIILVERCYSLCYIESICMENTCEVFD